ncbi:MAG: ABC transporter substrate-binding protein [Desulforhopalus sp.]
MSVLIKTAQATDSIRLSFLIFLFFWLTLPLSPRAESAKYIIDSSGQTISVEKPFTRIISLYSAHTENLCSLGAEELLVGISRSDDYPPSITNKPRFSYREDPEKFIALQPDLVLVRPMIERSYPQFIDKLKRAGIVVVSLQPNGVDEMFDYWENLGILTGNEAAAKEMIAAFNSRLQSIQYSLKNVEADQRPKVYFQSIHSKMKTFAKESIGVFVLEQAGGINIAAGAEQVRGTNIAYVGKEQLLSLGAEIDIFLAQRGIMNPVNLDIIMKEPGFGAIKAIRNGQVYLIEEALVSRPTLRILDGIEQLNTLFFHSKNQELQPQNSQ